MAGTPVDPNSLTGLLKAPDAKITPGHVLFGGVVALVAGLGLFISGFQKLRLKRQIEDTPVSKIRSLAMGRVEVSGKVVPFQQITMTPFSNLPCVYFRYTLEERHLFRDEKGRQQESWSEIDSGHWSVPFQIEDDTGRVLIDPRGAAIESSCGKVREPLLETEIPPAIASRVGLPRRDILRYNETFIPPDAGLFVLGFAGDNPNGAANADDAAGGKMIQQHGDDAFCISDRPRQEVLRYDASYAHQAIIAGAVIATLGLIAAVYAASIM